MKKVSKEPNPHTRKVISVGKSLAITLPEEARKYLKIIKGSKVKIYFATSADGDVLAIEK